MKAGGQAARAAGWRHSQGKRAVIGDSVETSNLSYETRCTTKGGARVHVAQYATSLCNRLTIMIMKNTFGIRNA